MLPIDKSGRFGVMSLENYLLAGEKHTKEDTEVKLEDIVRTQNELNGNISMLIKFLRIGHLWKHQDRARTTMINHSLTLCPMYLTYKDHKGSTGVDNSPPPHQTYRRGEHRDEYSSIRSNI